MGNESIDDVYDRVAAMAAVNAGKFSGSSADQTRQLRELIESGSLVFAVYPDDGEPRGVGFLIIKGEGYLEQIGIPASAESEEWSAFHAVRSRKPRPCGKSLAK